MLWPLRVYEFDTPHLPNMGKVYIRKVKGDQLTLLGCMPCIISLVSYGRTFRFMELTLIYTERCMLIVLDYICISTSSNFSLFCTGIKWSMDLKIKQGNVKGNSKPEHNGKQVKQLMECKKVTSYTSIELKVIYSDTKGHKCYKILKPGVCNKVRKLQLNRRSKGGKHLKCSFKQMGVNHDNITIINKKNEYTKSRSIHGIKGCLVNIQSLKNKDLALRGHLTANQIDICLNTETTEKQ